MSESIYKMKLHTEIKISTSLHDYLITRVPGGWIYTSFSWNYEKKYSK